MNAYSGGLKVKSYEGSGLTDQLKTFNNGQSSALQSSADFNPNAFGDKMMAQGIMGAGKAMQSSMSKDTYTPYQHQSFGNSWQDISSGELQSTGQAGASMNLYIQKMLSNPAIMQLLQQRMQGVSNG